MKRHWWDNRNIYQIYLRSFFDSNNDGIGDIPGLEAKLDYLSDLAIGIIWVSPFYDSPMDDNGYDVRNFHETSVEYGTIADFARLIKAAHERDIKILTDLVLNHTSDEHPWFVAARDPNHPDHEKYHDYYIWQKPRYDASGNMFPPTRWQSWFGSSAWEYNHKTDEYFLHIFSCKMPDLNWQNESLRADMKKMIFWWINFGVDGFRVDAASHLEKDFSFPDDYPGYQHFSGLPGHHRYLQELGEELFVPNNLLTIGESGGAGAGDALDYLDPGRHEFDLLLQFGHCWADVDEHHPDLLGKWAEGALSVRKIKESFHHWYEALKGIAHNVIYWHNHDQPRILSHYGTDVGEYRERSAKMLCLALYFMPGTAICYQGEEIGMENVDYESIDDFRDVEAHTCYSGLLAKGYSDREALTIIRRRSRDNARSPMQWENSENAGFSTAKPWIRVNRNYPEVNVSRQDRDPDSILNLYRQVLNLRKRDSDIVFGEITFLDLESDDSYIYLNRGKNKTYLVVSNFREREIEVDLGDLIPENYRVVFHNLRKMPKIRRRMVIEPYAAIVGVSYEST